MSEYCWSRDGEEFTGRFPTRDAALADAESEAWCDCTDSETLIVSTGRIKYPIDHLRPSARYIGGSILETLDEWLSNDIESDDFIITMSPEDKEALGDLVCAFLIRRASFRRWGVVEVEEHQIEVPDDNEGADHAETKHTPGPWQHIVKEDAVTVAAPELLNALTVLADACEKMGIPVNAARAAIEKATGGKA